mmetsp:Transcript_5727/g.14825  ORF Transcript_5727/g.14825 Transcript_5727/m.14825 type:complete len:215 (+) Transcript_5727:239-883(+)
MGCGWGHHHGVAAAAGGVAVVRTSGRRASSARGGPVGEAADGDEGEGGPESPAGAGALVGALAGEGEGEDEVEEEGPEGTDANLDVAGAPGDGAEDVGGLEGLDDDDDVDEAADGHVGVGPVFVGDDVEDLLGAAGEEDVELEEVEFEGVHADPFHGRGDAIGEPGRKVPGDEVGRDPEGADVGIDPAVVLALVAAVAREAGDVDGDAEDGEGR